MRLILLAVTLIMVTGCGSPDPSILVFSKTAGYRHASIPQGQAMFTRMAEERGYVVEFTEDSTAFTDVNLQRFDAIVFLLTTADVLDATGQRAMERFIQAGGGYLGIHAASDTEYGWPWYGRLVGGYFVSHPPGLQRGIVSVADSTAPGAMGLPATFEHEDEYYDFRYTNRLVNVALTVDDFSYRTREEGAVRARRPIAWHHEFDGGRAFYTALGHPPETYEKPLFVNHIATALEWVSGERGSKDYAASTVRPDDSDFVLDVLADTLNEPMEVDVLPDGRALFVERGGEVHLVDPETSTDVIAAELTVWSEFEDGLLGLAIDPDFAENRRVYLYYSPPDESLNRLSRFEFEGDRLDLITEEVILEVPTHREECCHSGGSVEFGPNGLLYLSTGDDTNPFASSGFAPTDERPGRSAWDAQRTSANANDLRGKILRIRPEADGGYSIPEGNLFPADGSRGRPEVYAMGLRNPFRISIDARTGWLYWGDIGPDAADDDSSRGLRGHDEINQGRGAGFFGWPYFIADNQPYALFDFARGQAGEFAVGAAPINESRNNTGRTFLPPAQGAWIWYPYSETDLFPLLGLGGRSAMAGPVYYHDRYADRSSRFPAYFDGRLFIHEWMRNRIFSVEIDRNGDYAYMEEFLGAAAFSRPVDMAFGPDGSLYVLEYGNQWNAENPDARLVRIRYAERAEPAS